MDWTLDGFMNFIIVIEILQTLCLLGLFYLAHKEDRRHIYKNLFPEPLDSGEVVEGGLRRINLKDGSVENQEYSREMLKEIHKPK